MTKTPVLLSLHHTVIIEISWISVVSGLLSISLRVHASFVVVLRHAIQDHSHGILNR